MSALRIVFAGSPEAASPSLRLLAASRHEVVAAITREDTPQGRRHVLTSTAVASEAAELEIPVLKTNTVASIANDIAALRPDLGVIVAYGALIREPLLSLPRLGWINLHFSLLPRWRGAAPVQRAIIAGDELTGATVFGLVPQLDAGAVYGQFTQAIGANETAGHLLASLADAGAQLLLRVVDALAEGSARAEPQSGDVTTAPKLTLEDGRIDWSAHGAVVANLIRGVTPEPGAFTMLGGQRIKVLAAMPAPGIRQPAGQFGDVDGRVLVGTGSDALELLAVQPAGQEPDARRGLVARPARRRRPPSPTGAEPRERHQSPHPAGAARRIRGDQRGARNRRLRQPAAARAACPHRVDRGGCRSRHRTRLWHAAHDGLLRQGHRARGAPADRADRRARSSTSCASEPTSCCRCASHSTRRSMRPSPSPARSGPARRPGSSTACCARSRAARRSSGMSSYSRGQTNDDDRLSAEHSHPVWIIRAFRRALAAEGRDEELEALLDADNAPPHVSLTALPGLSTALELPGAKPGRFSPFAAVSEGGDPAHWPAVRGGRARVQDEGSQLAALALSRARPIVPGERWLDLCAGPGGKAALLAAEAAAGGATLVANEVVPARATLVRNALAAFETPPEVLELDGRDFGETHPASVRPHPARRAVHRARRATPAPRGALAQTAPRRRRARGRCRSSSWIRSRRAEARRHPRLRHVLSAPRRDPCRGAECAERDDGIRTLDTQAVLAGSDRRAARPAARGPRAAVAAPARHRRHVHPAAAPRRVARQ